MTDDPQTGMCYGERWLFSAFIPALLSPLALFLSYLVVCPSDAALLAIFLGLPLQFLILALNSALTARVRLQSRLRNFLFGMLVVLLISPVYAAFWLCTR